MTVKPASAEIISYDGFKAALMGPFTGWLIIFGPPA